jgi:hypothetical protein
MLPFVIGVLSGIVGTMLTPPIQFWIDQLFFPNKSAANIQTKQIVYILPFKRDRLSKFNKLYQFLTHKNQHLIGVYFKTIFICAALIVICFPIASLFLYDNDAHGEYTSRLSIGLSIGIWYAVVLIWCAGWLPAIVSILYVRVHRVWRRHLSHISERYLKAIVARRTIT